MIYPKDQLEYNIFTIFWRVRLVYYQNTLSTNKLNCFFTKSRKRVNIHIFPLLSRETIDIFPP